MTKMTLPMEQMPSAISESVTAVLQAHGLTLSPELLRELGNNVTQALWALDPSDGDIKEPAVAERLSVGHTLRTFARVGQPNPETAEALMRVGTWLVEVAQAELGKGSRAA